MPTLTDLMVAELTRSDIATRVPARARETWQTFQRILLHAGGALMRVAQSPPSPGYEPWFVERGGGRLGARGLAYLLVRAGKRRARDHRWHRQAVKALRDLARPLRYGCAVRDRAQTLLQCWEYSTVLDTIFDGAGGDVFEFVRLLKAALAGNTSVFSRLAEIAVGLSPVLTIPSGPKRSAASEAHALFLEVGRDFGARAYTWNDLDKSFTDAQTQATRLAFKEPNFSPVSARRRVKRGLGVSRRRFAPSTPNRPN
jgi:hypothetical protein